MPCTGSPASAGAGKGLCYTVTPCGGPSLQSGYRRHFACRERWRLLIWEPPIRQGTGHKGPFLSFPPPLGIRSCSPPSSGVVLFILKASVFEVGYVKLCFFSWWMVNLLSGFYSPPPLILLEMVERKFGYSKVQIFHLTLEL